MRPLAMLALAEPTGFPCGDVSCRPRPLARARSSQLKSPRSVRHAVSYVLNNWRHHRADRGRTWLVDPFSSGSSFAGWKELAGASVMWKPPPRYEPLWVWLPQTWLLQRAFGAISARDVPG